MAGERITHNITEPIKSLTFFITEKCNLNCKYCYQVHGKRSIPLEVGIRSIDWLFSHNQLKDREMNFSFYGGEPLLEFPTLKKLVSYCAEKSGSLNRKVRFGMTTNGLLITPGILKFLKEFKFGITLSIDGDERTHDQLRRNYDGSGTFKKLSGIIPGLLEVAPRTLARMTINPSNVGDVFENFKHLCSMGFDHIAPTPNTEAEWTNEHWSTLDIQYRQILNHCLWVLLEKDRKITVPYVDDDVEYIARIKRRAAPCGAGKNSVTISHDGTIYPCIRFVSLNNFEGACAIGNVWDGMDEEKRLPFKRYTCDTFLGCNTSCARCDARIICGGGCMAKGYEYNNNFFLPLANEQKWMYIRYHSTIQVYQYLKENFPAVLETYFKVPKPDKEMA